MAKRLLFIHGRGPQVDAQSLSDLWRQGVEIGLARDADDVLGQLSEASVDMFYYADRTEHLYDDTADLDELQDTLGKLAKRKKRRDFRRRFYDELPGKSALGEFAMDLAASAGLGGVVMRKVAPELDLYWRDTAFRQAMDHDLHVWLKEHAATGDDLCVVTHCVGSVFFFDCLSQLDIDISSWVTLGSPLGDRAVQNNLPQGFAASVNHWVNLSAEDDVISHHKTLASQFSGLIDDEKIETISDYTIYNLAQVDERSDPSHWAGYLVHPRLTDTLQAWLDNPER